MFKYANLQLYTVCTLTELFRKRDNSRQIYKQASSTFYASNGVSRRKN